MSPKNRAPFGSSSERFGKITVHPNLDPSGLYSKRSKACDPCLYHPIPIHKIFEVNKDRKKDKDPWRYKKELEEWAVNLGYRNQKVLASRRWFDSLLGPAWTEVPPEKKCDPAVCKNVGFGRAPRFRPSKNNLPGPGRYYRAIPYKAPYGPHSSKMTFEREVPCRFPNTTPTWSLAPDRYKINDPDSIENKSKKVVSLRGPYDLFSGVRDEKSIKNHFNTTYRCSAKTWPIALKSTLNLYTKSHFGEMNKTNRSLPYRGRSALVDGAMCLRRTDEPGPAHLNLRDCSPLMQYRYGFNSSYDRPPGYKRVVVWPGVGRYSPKDTRSLPGNGHRYVFLSKLGRTMGVVLPQPMNSF